MKVAILLTPTQTQRAEQILRDLPSNEELDHAMFNPDQRLYLQDDLLVYEGQRCPFHQDGKLTAVEEILTGADYPGKNPPRSEEDRRERNAQLKMFNKAAKAACEAATVVYYETTDPRLQWFETLESYMFSRAPLDELVEYVHHLKVWRMADYFDPDRVEYCIPRLWPVCEAARKILAGDEAVLPEWAAKLGKRLLEILEHNPHQIEVN